MERPDSALLVLESIDRNCLAHERDKALNALLYAMALDKNYIDVSDDSIAKAAVNYFSKRGSEKYRARSHYYLGIAYYYQKEYTKAIVEFTKSEQAAVKCDSLYLGMSLLAQADTYSHTYNDAERLSSLMKSYDVFNKTDNKYYLDVVRANLAQTYANMGHYEDAFALYPAMIDDETISENLRVDMIGSYAFAIMSCSEPDYVKAKTLYDTLDVRYDRRYMSYRDYWSWAYALHLSGDKSKADGIIRQLSEIDTSVVATFWKYRISRSCGDYRTALSLLEEHSRQHGSAVDSLLKQSLSSAQRDYFRSQSEISGYKIVIRNMWISVILLTSLFGFIVLLSVVRKRIKKEQEEKEKVIEYIEEINRQFNIPFTADASSLKSKFIALYKSRFDTLGILCNQYFAHDGYDGAEKLMYKRVWSLIEDIRNDTARRKGFEKLLDDELNNIMTNIRREMPKLKEVDYTLFSYFVAGFDMSAISRLLDMSLNNVYAHKRRLRLKIEKKYPAHAQQFLEMMA